MDEISIPAIRFEQNGRVFYCTAIPVQELLDRSKVDIWSADAPTEDAGYQREPSRARLREVANYMEGDDAIMPLGGLVNARGVGDGEEYGERLRFEPSGPSFGRVQAGLLTLAEDALPLFVVDMQHRLGGLRVAMEDDQRDDLADFPVVATIADGLSRLEEIEQFELINTTQKKVRTDLARRLMAIQIEDPERRVTLEVKGRLWEARGPVIADWLNRHGKVWRGRIVPPNKSKREMPNGIARETSFVTSLKPVLQTPLFARMQDDQVATVLDRYWEAIERIFPSAFQRPGENVIQKTAGVFSLHSLAPDVVELVRSDYPELSAENFEKALAPLRALGADYWRADNVDGAGRYGGMKGYAQLAVELRRLLPELQFDLI